MSEPNPRIVILGGGTAGWMAACLMAKAWPAATITLIESPDIGIVGVGEGSTPQLAGLFATLGIAEADWMPAAHATYKLGIRFEGWSAMPGQPGYFHPFINDIDRHTEVAFHAAARARRMGHDVPAHPDRYFLNSWLASNGRGPFPADTFPFQAGYGYHFDAHLVGAVLRRNAIERGVRHLSRRVEQVLVATDGSVAALVLDGGEAVAADLFVDASGFRGVIAQAALGERFVSFAGNLFNDAAVVAPTPPGDAGPEPFTTATTLRNGWAWRIPLTSRVGNGYVYSTRYASSDDAEAELRAHLALPDDAPVRHLAMRVGRVERCWRANCLAVGLAQGFLEPLEATALHLVQASVEGFIADWRAGGFTPLHRDAYNDRIARRYEGIRDYLVAHYRLSRRADTPYWRNNAANQQLSDTLKAMMTCWFTGGDVAANVKRLEIESYYAPLSWGCLFAGYDTFPEAARLRPADPSAFALPPRFLARCGANFPPHRDALAALSSGRC